MVSHLVAADIGSKSIRILVSRLDADGPIYTSVNRHLHVWQSNGYRLLKGASTLDEIGGIISTLNHLELGYIIQQLDFLPLSSLSQ